nr:phospholipase A and acyltransferase 5 isoform X1 [Gorilla gorilla gorilla]
MGLSPGAEGEYALRLPRIPPPRPKPGSRTAGTGPKDQPPALRRSTVPHSGLNSISPLELEESVGSAALVQLPAKQPPPGTLEQGRSIQQGEKSVVSLETTPSQKADWSSIPKPENEGKLIKQAAEGSFVCSSLETAVPFLGFQGSTNILAMDFQRPAGHRAIEAGPLGDDNTAVKGKPRPRPGDLIEIFRIGYEHWAIYVEDDCVVHLAPPSEEFEVGSITSIFSNRAVVKYSRLEDVLHGCSWKVNNKLDGTYLPLPVDKIIQRTKKMVNKIVQYSLIEGNCEHFVNGLRYGVPRSQQVEHALMEGAKAAGAAISAVVDSIKRKPITA